MFRAIHESLLVAPQISVADVIDAKAQGVVLIINNRPDDEEPDQPSGAEIASAAAQAGLSYVAIPVTHAGFSAPQVDAMAQALAGSEGKVLAYCRSGTRSTLLWSLAAAKQGVNPSRIASMAAGAGYDISPVRPMVDALAAGCAD